MQRIWFLSFHGVRKERKKKHTHRVSQLAKILAVWFDSQDCNETEITAIITFNFFSNTVLFDTSLVFSFQTSTLEKILQWANGMACEHCRFHFCSGMVYQVAGKGLQSLFLPEARWWHQSLKKEHTPDFLSHRICYGPQESTLKKTVTAIQSESVGAWNWSALLVTVVATESKASSSSHSDINFLWTLILPIWCTL